MTMVTKIFLVSLVVAIAGILATDARKRAPNLANTVYGLSLFPNQTAFQDYNPASGLVTNVSVIAFVPDPNLPVAIDTVGSRVFLLGNYVNNATHTLITFDIDSGAMLYSPLYTGYNVTRLFYDQAYGLVGFMQNPLLGKPLLTRFNVMAGYAEPIRALPPISTAALNIVNDSLWVVFTNGASTTVASLDLGTGDIYDTGVAFPSSTFVSDVAFDAATNAFLGVCTISSSNSNLDICSLDLASGNVTRLNLLPSGQLTAMTRVSLDAISRSLFVVAGASSDQMWFFEFDLNQNTLVNVVRNTFSWFDWNGNVAVGCMSFADCKSCATAVVCEWCLDQGGCNSLNNTCTSVIQNPSFCQKDHCSSLTSCSDCLNSSTDCDWCLDTSSCVPRPATGCPDRVNNQDMCNDKAAKLRA
eukprot:TRINITY_DN7062_c0_g1_i2.p1 TRINITY_DN7062_c0_g1~~TRINITY_DN7062_c0_g1_i2.p1  ORF type:complete len:414 (+),score=123.08 TRINITY_DN7062_c0_g1_i2:1571-2812(+)